MLTRLLLFDSDIVLLPKLEQISHNIQLNITDQFEVFNDYVDVPWLTEGWTLTRDKANADLWADWFETTDNGDSWSDYILLLTLQINWDSLFSLVSDYKTPLKILA